MPAPHRSNAAPYPDPAGFVPFATAALDFHRALNLPAEPAAASRADLDALHAHLVSLYAVLDTHAQHNVPVDAREGGQLRVACIRLWQAADHLHTAFHTTPHLDPTLGKRTACQTGLPEGAPELTICQRHQVIGLQVRRRTTPADLHAPITGHIHY